MSYRPKLSPQKWAWIILIGVIFTIATESLSLGATIAVVVMIVILHFGYTTDKE